MTRSYVVACFLASTAMTGFASTAAAQGGASAPASGSSVNVEELVVTARRREERILDVPLSIAAVGAEEIRTRGLVNSEDYLRGMPGVGQSETGYNSGQSIVIRGIETTPSAQNFSTGPTYASYFGETPTTNSAGINGGTSIDLKLVDINRVEVLRGPQGAAFGDAALGGAVRTIPNAPKLGVTEGEIGGEASSTGHYGGANYNVFGTVNLPVGDRAAVRAVAYNFSQSGFYRNIAASDPAFQAGPVTQYGARANTVDKARIGDEQVWGGRVSALFKPTDAVGLTLNALYQKNEADGLPIANSGVFTQSLFRIGPSQVRRNQPWGYADGHIAVVNPAVTADLGIGELVVSYSRMKSGSANAEPYAIFGLSLPVSQGQPSRHREDVGEVRFTSHLSGPINGVIGVFKERVHDKGYSTYEWFGSGATNTYRPGFQGVIGRIDLRRVLKQTSVYGQVFWEIVPRLTLTAGARYYDYTRSFSDIRTGPFLVGAAAASVFQGQVGANGVSPSANLSYKPSKSTMVYAAYSQGFRLGTPQAPLPASTCDRNGDGQIDGTQIGIASTGALTTDKMKNYEAGAKGAFLNGAVTADMAVFHMLWDGVPVRVLAPSPCNLTYQANAGKASSDGVEFSTTMRLASGLRANLGLSYIRAKLDQDVPALGAKAGNRLPGAPKWTGSLGVQYDHDVGSLPAFVRADVTYVGSTYGNLINSAAIYTKAYTKIDLMAGVTYRDVRAALFVRNLADNDAYASRGTNPGIPPYYGYRLQPRTIGVRLDYRFGD